MKNYLYPLFLATVLTTVACSDDDKVTNFIEEEIPADQKEPIAFTVSDLGATNQGSQTRAGFTAATQIVARFESAHEDTSKGTRSTRTILTAAADGTLVDASYSTVDYYKASDDDKSYIRYWDDAFGRYASISVYAVAVPAKTDVTNNTSSLKELVDFTGDPVSTTSNPNWKTGSTNNTISWSVEKGSSTTSGTVTTITGQTKESIDKEDLCYSNNIQATPTTADKNRGKYGRYVYDFTLDNGNEKGYPAMSGIAANHSNGPLKIALKTPSDKTSNGKFDKGHLIFEHALSRITVTLAKSGDYIGDFTFSNGNIKLLSMNVSGKLDIKTGLWDETKTTGDIHKMAPVAKNSSGSLVADDTRTVANGTYMAQMLPGYVFTKDNKTTNVMEFTIDNNTYFITQADLFKSLNDNAGTGDGKNGLVTDATAYTMEMGKNYVFTITLNKAKIENITATVANWVDVEAAELKLDNSHVEFSFLSPTGTKCDEINFYRLAEDLGMIYTDNSYITDNKGVTFSGNYGTAATLTAMTGTNAGKYSTNWFYDNNRTAYHFRTLNNIGKDALVTPTTDPKNSYFKMTADATSKDYHWGAPMKISADLAYSITEGYKSSLHEGITSTWSDIKIQELHMMSNLEIVLKTEGDGKVDLSGATVTLTKLSTSANVDMGIGLITPLAPESPTTWATATQATTAPTNYWASGQETNKLQTNAFTCAVIPQVLVRNASSTPSADDYVGITITTKDENQYYVIAKLSEIMATSIQKGGNVYDDPDHPKDTEGNYQAITRWYPNHTYKYTFTITKKGIENITCTVADWITVTGADTKIDLES